MYGFWGRPPARLWPRSGRRYRRMPQPAVSVYAGQSAAHRPPAASASIPARCATVFLSRRAHAHGRAAHVPSLRRLCATCKSAPPRCGTTDLWDVYAPLAGESVGVFVAVGPPAWCSGLRVCPRVVSDGTFALMKIRPPYRRRRRRTETPLPQKRLLVCDLRS